MRKSAKPRSWGTATIAIHGHARRRKAHHAVSTPIVQTSNFSFDNMTEVVEFMKAKGEGRIIREQEYGRYGNPTQQEAERKLAAIEGAERAILFSTGMSAVIMTLMAYMKRDGHIIFTAIAIGRRAISPPACSPNSASKPVSSRRPPRRLKKPSVRTRTSSLPNRRRILTC